MSSYTNKTMICPFYISNDKLEMVCEGDIKVTFPDRISIMEYQAKYCGSFDYYKCPIAERKLKEYEEEID